MSPYELAQLEDLYQKAKTVWMSHSSPFDHLYHAPPNGPWKYSESPADDIHVRHARVCVMGRLMHDSSTGGEWDWPVLEYMAAACNAVPLLLEHIRRLESRP